MRNSFCIFLLIFVFNLATGQTSDTTFLSIDSLGIRKVTSYVFIGTGGGFVGSLPRLTKRTIAKYDSKGQLIYLSHHTSRYRGCIHDTPKFNIIAYGEAGNKMTLTQKRKRIILIKECDQNRKHCKKTKLKFTKLDSFPDWVDIGDRD